MKKRPGVFPPKPCPHVLLSPLPTKLSLLSALRFAFAVVVFLARLLPSFHASFHGSYNPWRLLDPALLQKKS
jgi:hypothetical protein